MVRMRQRHRLYKHQHCHQNPPWSRWYPESGCCLLFRGWQMAHPGERGTCATLHRPVMQLAQRRDLQGRIHFRKLNGKGENAHIKKTNSSSSACLGMWAPVLMVVFINSLSCLISGDNYHSQAIDTSLMGRSPAGMAGLGFSEMQSPLTRWPCLCKEKCHVLALNKQTKPLRAGESHSGMQRGLLCKPNTLTLPRSSP